MSIVWEKFKALPGERKALCVFIPLILMALIASWYDKTPQRRANSGFPQAPPIAGTEGGKTDVKIKPGTVKVIPKKKVKDAVDPLPPEVDEPDIEVTATAEVPPSEAGTQVISTINVTTGDTKIFQKENKLPLIGFESLKRIGVGYGYSTRGTTAKVYGDYSFLRVGVFHLGVQAEIEATTTRVPEAKAMAIIDCRWK